MDYRNILILLIFVLFLWVLTNQTKNNKTDDTVDKTFFVQNQSTFDGDYNIIVNDKLYNKFVDILLGFVRKSDDPDIRTLCVYIATFEIFNLNFHHKRLEKLDEKLNGVKLYVTDIDYPSFNKYHNLQSAIANLVGKELTKTSRNITADNDRQMVNVYISTIFDLFGVVRVRARA